MPRLFAIGDLHGCIDELDVLLDHLAPRGDDQFIFLGDYIDRGPSPKGVVDRLLRLWRDGTPCVFLKGNHEDMFLDFLELGGHYGEAFLHNGGRATLRSYGIENLRGADAAALLPSDHLDFYRRLETYRVVGNYLFVHAGIRPGYSLEEQNEEDLMWIREDFTRQPHQLGLTVIFGHSPNREIYVDMPYKIGLDTGVVYRNKLSCLEISAKILHQIGRGEHRVAETNLARIFA